MEPQISVRMDSPRFVRSSLRSTIEHHRLEAEFLLYALRHTPGFFTAGIRTGMHPEQSVLSVDSHRIGQPAEIHAHLAQERIGVARDREGAELHVDAARLSADRGRGRR